VAVALAVADPHHSQSTRSQPLTTTATDGIHP